MDEVRKGLLIDLERIVGHEFYNSNIQNWGPGGVFEGEGRAFRYPVNFVDKDGGRVKFKRVDPGMSADVLITGSYKVGANELNIMRALDQIVSHLEKNYGLSLRGK